MILRAYIDESGTHGKSSPYTVLGGFFSDSDRWTDFDREWAAFLDKHSIEYLHAVDLLNSKLEFKSFKGGMPEKTAIAKEAFEIATRWAIGFVAVIENKHFDEVLKGQEQKLQIAMDTKYGVCFRRLLYFLTDRAESENAGALEIYLEEGAAGSGGLVRITEEFLLHAELAKSDRLHRVVSVNKKIAYGTQASDLLVYSYFQQRNSAFYNLSHPRFLLNKELFQAPKIFDITIPKSGMENYVAVMKFKKSLAKIFGKKFSLQKLKRHSSRAEGDLLLTSNLVVIWLWLFGLPKTRLDLSQLYQER